MPDPDQATRWRLALGKEAEEQGMSLEADEAKRMERLLNFVFETDDGERSGGSGASTLSVPGWIDGVSELFPAEAKEVMEKELIDRRGIGALLKEPDLLDRVEPNVEMVKTLLTHKDLLSPETRVLARKIIEKVVQALKERMKLQVVSAITGAIRRDRHSPRQVFRNLDLAMTIRRNLKNYDREAERLLVDQLFFFAAERNKRPWHIIIAVDQSGSMLGSAVHSAVMASIFYELPSVKTTLFLFDTQLVDLSDQLGQPVDVLLSVNLGGGTDIAMAMTYARQCVREPARSIVVLISDFYEGGDERVLLQQTQDLHDAGVRQIGLGALGYDARPAYCKRTAKQLRKRGMDILVCTPEKLAECIAAIIRT